MSNKNLYICGADNGFSGSMAFINIKTQNIDFLEPYPRENTKLLFDIFKKYKPIKMVLEKPFITRGFKGVSSSNYEILGRYAQTLDYFNIPYEVVQVSHWRKSLNIKAKGREENKKASIQKCQEIFNEDSLSKLYSTRNALVDHKITKITYLDDNKCESALIAYYALQDYLKGNK